MAMPNRNRLAELQAQDKAAFAARQKPNVGAAAGPAATATKPMAGSPPQPGGGAFAKPIGGPAYNPKPGGGGDIRDALASTTAQLGGPQVAEMLKLRRRDPMGGGGLAGGAMNAMNKAGKTDLVDFNKSRAGGPPSGGIMARPPMTLPPAVSGPGGPQTAPLLFNQGGGMGATIGPDGVPVVGAGIGGPGAQMSSSWDDPNWNRAVNTPGIYRDDSQRNVPGYDNVAQFGNLSGGGPQLAPMPAGPGGLPATGPGSLSSYLPNGGGAQTADLGGAGMQDMNPVTAMQFGANAPAPFVGQGGNAQAMGAGRYGGAPPPNVLARRQALADRQRQLVLSQMGPY